MAEKKLNIYRIIIPEKDFKNSSETDQDTLMDILRRIDGNRVGAGKNTLSSNKYIVCNLDEPYSEKVWQKILKGEDEKKTIGGIKNMPELIIKSINQRTRKTCEVVIGSPDNDTENESLILSAHQVQHILRLKIDADDEEQIQEDEK